MLGGLLESGSHASEAAGHYREAIRLRPDFGKAHLDLGAVLLRSKQRDPALKEFRLAALEPDPEIRQTALQGLGALGLLP